MRPWLAERVQHVGRGDQAGGAIQLGRAYPGRVTGPVRALVMTAGYQAQRREHRRARQNPARVIRVQPHQLPVFRAQRARPLPDAGRDGYPPEVVDQPGAVDQRGLARAEPLSRSPGQPRDASGVAGEPRALQIGGVTEPGQGLVQGGFVTEHAPRLRLGPGNRRLQIIRARDPQQLSRRVQEDRRDRRIKRAPGPPGDRPGRGHAARDSIEHHRRVPTAANRAASATSSPARPAWHAAAIEALEGVQNGAAHRLRQPQAPRQDRAHLAVRACSLSLQPCHTLSAAQDPQAFSIHAKARKELHRLCRHRRVDQVAAGPDDDVITAECRGDLMRRRRAPGEPQQRPVVDLALANPIQPRPPGKLGREQARAHRLTRRMPASRIARHRQRRDHAADPHQLTHRRKPKEQPRKPAGRPAVTNLSPRQNDRLRAHTPLNAASLKKAQADLGRSAFRPLSQSDNSRRSRCPHAGVQEAEDGAR